MIEQLIITNKLGETLTLTLRTSGIDEGLLVFSMDGLGTPDGTAEGTRGPNQDGYISGTVVQVEARHIVLTLAVVPGTDSDAARAKIHKFFPSKTYITFRVITSTRDVYISALVESVEMNEFSKVENAVINLVCPKPYFIDINETPVTITEAGVNIVYDGEESTGVILSIDFTGIVTAPIITITNNQFNQSMTIDTYPVLSTLTPNYAQNLDQIVVDTRVGQKGIIFVRSSVVYNLIGGVGPLDDWIKLGHDTSRTNLVAWSEAAGPNSNIDVELDYQELYKGI